jgi:endoglucanase
MLYVQVGDGNVDNNYWVRSPRSAAVASLNAELPIANDQPSQGPDTTIPTPRPSFFVDRDQPGTDVAAGTAGALAAGAIFYATVIGDQQYAQKLLEHALSLYYFAESAKRTLYHMSVPAVKEWYASSDYSVSAVPCARWRR